MELPLNTASYRSPRPPKNGVIAKLNKISIKFAQFSIVFDCLFNSDYTFGPHISFTNSQKL